MGCRLHKITCNVLIVEWDVVDTLLLLFLFLFLLLFNLKTICGHFMMLFLRIL